jgi:outer membrane immunogenic protein
MKSGFLPAGFATLIALVAAPAMAADMRMPVKAPPPAPAPVYSWTGFYIGGHVGGAWGDKDWVFAESNDFFIPPPGFPSFGSHNVSGLIAGGQVGVNWQAPGSNWVLGIEGQASWTNADGEHSLDAFGFGTFTLKTNVKWLGTVTGRLGYAFDRVLVYAKGGFAFARDKHEFVDEIGFPFFAEKTRTGWTAGGGLEYAFAGNWSAKLEYNYMDFGNKHVTFLDAPSGDFFTFDVEQKFHAVKFGINYRFGPGPVVARY